MSVPPTASPTILAQHLRELRAERALVRAGGVVTGGASLADLEEEIAACAHAYVGAVVTEIATSRAELSGRLLG
jgi:Na+-translocating ferredoxin:NAD+ oxidoreductase RnfC subunit